MSYEFVTTLTTSSNFYKLPHLCDIVTKQNPLPKKTHPKNPVILSKVHPFKFQFPKCSQ